MAQLKFYKRVKAPPEYPGKTYNNGNCLLHHLVWWQNTGDLVPVGFVLHHKNEDKFDNRFENLELLSNTAHCQKHGEARHADLLLRCPVCAKEFTCPASKARMRQKRNADGNLCCSRQCGIRHRYARGIGPQQGALDLTHGSAVAYSYHKCRCAECKAGHAQRHKEYREKNKGRRC